MAEISKNDTNTSRIENAITKISKALRLCAGQSKYDFEK